MRIATVVACLIVLCVLAALAAEVGPVTGPVTGVTVFPRPDLIVKQVDISRGGPVEFPNYTFRITVANIGTANAGATQTGLVSYALFNTSQPMGAGLMGQVDTPAIAAGAQTVVTFVTDRVTPKMYIFVGADFPGTDHQLGAVGESKETNNAMTVPLNTSGTFPRTYK